MYSCLNEIVVIVLCCMLSPVSLESPFAVVGLLAAVILCCLCKTLPGRYILPATLIFDVAAVAFEPTAAFLPVCAYLSLHLPNPFGRFPWVAALAVSIALHTPFSLHDAALALLCGVSALLAMRNVRIEHDLAALRTEYDRTRGRLMKDRKAGCSSTGDDAGAQTVQAAESEADRSPSSDMPAFSNLSNRELTVVNLIAEGMDNREIATRLFLSEGTVRNIVSSILSKESLSNRTQIAVAYYRNRS